MRIRLRSGWRDARLRRNAVQLASHGWPVIPGAALVADRFCCGPVCHTVGLHPRFVHSGGVPADVARVALTDPDLAREAWRDTASAVLLATGVVFDVLEAPAWLAAAAGRRVLLGPVALTPTGRWMYLIRPGARLRPELAGLPDVVLHGEGSWIPAPPTVTPQGRVRWVVSPDEVDWRPAPAQLLQDWLVGGLPMMRRGTGNRLIAVA
jgi:hypothetical protein